MRNRQSDCVDAGAVVGGQPGEDGGDGGGGEGCRVFVGLFLLSVLAAYRLFSSSSPPCRNTLEVSFVAVGAF